MDKSQAFGDFLQVQSSEKTRQQADTSYTGSAHIHYGIPVPTLREFVKTWVETNKPIDYPSWETLLDNLYHGESLEERHFAGILLDKFPKFRRELSLEKLDQWLGQLVGWEEVDATCQSNFTDKDMLPKWSEWEAFLRQLAQDENINKRRASLVLLLKPLRSSADTRFLHLALEQVGSLAHEKDRLITKAVSWVLREGIKHHREAIAHYLQQNEACLPAIAIRETRKKLETGKKS